MDRWIEGDVVDRMRFVYRNWMQALADEFTVWVERNTFIEFGDRI